MLRIWEEMQATLFTGLAMLSPLSHPAALVAATSIPPILFKEEKIGEKRKRVWSFSILCYFYVKMNSVKAHWVNILNISILKYFDLHSNGKG